MSDFNELELLGPKWYVAHTYTGYENKVKNTIEKIVENRKEFSELIFDVKVPVITTVETDAKGREKTVEEKLFPAYVFIKMKMNDDSWHIIRHITGVTGFVGPGSKPVPLTDEEVLSIAVEEKIDTNAFQVGDEVEVIDGYLKARTGKIHEIAQNGEITIIIPSLGNTSVIIDAKSIKKI